MQTHHGTKVPIAKPGVLGHNGGLTKAARFCGVREEAARPEPQQRTDYSAD